MRELTFECCLPARNETVIDPEIGSEQRALGSRPQVLDRAELDFRRSRDLLVKVSVVARRVLAFAATAVEHMPRCQHFQGCFPSLPNRSSSPCRHRRARYRRQGPCRCRRTAAFSACRLGLIPRQTERTREREPTPQAEVSPENRRVRKVTQISSILMDLERPGVMRYRRFESSSLQRRVRCKPVSRGNSPF